MKNSPTKDFRNYLKGTRSVPVTIGKPKKLTARWTVEEPPDWNIPDEILDEMAEEIRKEIDEHMGTSNWNENDSTNK